MAREALAARRAAAIASLGPSAEAHDLSGPLIAVDKEAQSAGDEEFSRKLRPVIQACLAHASSAGTPERSARFSFVADDLRTPGSLAIVAEAADVPALPPLVRAHLFDLVWSLEHSPRAHPHAARNAADAYLAYDGAVRDLPDADRETGGWARLSDALARSCELAREAGLRDVAERAAGAVLRRFAQAEGGSDYRIVLEPGYGLLGVARLVPDALNGVERTLELARTAFLGARKFHLARGVVELEIAVAGEQGRNEKIDALRRASAESYVAEADDHEATANHLAATHFLEAAIHALNGLPDTRARVTELTRRLEGGNQAAGDAMKTISTEVKIPTERIEQYYRAFTDLPLPDALAAVADHFLLDRSQEYARYDENAARFVLTHLVSHRLMTEYGETVTYAPGTPEYREYMVFRQAVQGLGISSVFLREIFARLRASGLDATAVLSFLEECPIFTPSSRVLIADGVRRIFEDDHVGAVHILVPQLEAAIRALVSAASLPITRVGAQGSEMLLLGSLLSTLRRSGALEDRYVFTLEVALDRLGWNIRNRVAHGWITRAECTAETCDRLLQLLLALGLLRVNEDLRAS